MNSTIIMSRGYVTLIGIEFETQSCCKIIFIFLNNFPSILLTDYHQFIYVYAILTIPKAYFIFKPNGFAWKKLRLRKYQIYTGMIKIWSTFKNKALEIKLKNTILAVA